MRSRSAPATNSKHLMRNPQIEIHEADNTRIAEPFAITPMPLMVRRSRSDRLEPRADVAAF
jgi:hypothetical protein